MTDLAKVKRLVNDGDRKAAWKLLNHILSVDPANEQAWVLAHSLVNDSQKPLLLEKAREYLPKESSLFSPSQELPASWLDEEPQQLNRKNKQFGKIALVLFLSLIALGAAYTLISHNLQMNNLRPQVSKFIEEGSMLSGMTKVGVSYRDYGVQLEKARTAYSLALSVWPRSFAREARNSFDMAFEGWDLAFYLWRADQEDLDNPVEPNINRYLEFVNYAGDNLDYGIHHERYIVQAYRGRKFVKFDNIGVLFSLANDYFRLGQILILREMQKTFP